jgi:hypothetical protein
VMRDTLGLGTGLAIPMEREGGRRAVPESPERGEKTMTQPRSAYVETVRDVSGDTSFSDNVNGLLTTS